MEAFLGIIEKHAVVAFITLVLILGITFCIALVVSAYPGRFFINIMHKTPSKDINRFYFYYQKATAYRMLFLVHTIFYHTIRILGAVMTFVTVYCALDNNNYILFCSLVAAACEILGLIIPVDKYMKIYVQGARILEYCLNTEYIDEEMAKKELVKKYEEAEKIIAQDFL